MSIYATLWTLKFPKEGDWLPDCDWIEVTAQGVPAHIGSPSRGAGYEDGDPYAAFLPPPVEVDADGNAPFMRAVVFITEYTMKGTERAGQEYVSPLLVLTGKEYAQMNFDDVYERICTALRGNRQPSSHTLSERMAGKQCSARHEKSAKTNHDGAVLPNQAEIPAAFPATIHRLG